MLKWSQHKNCDVNKVCRCHLPLWPPIISVSIMLMPVRTFDSRARLLLLEAGLCEWDRTPTKESKTWKGNAFPYLHTALTLLETSSFVWVFCSSSSSHGGDHCCRSDCGEDVAHKLSRKPRICYRMSMFKRGGPHSVWTNNTYVCVWIIFKLKWSYKLIINFLFSVVGWMDDFRSSTFWPQYGIKVGIGEGIVEIFHVFM